MGYRDLRDYISALESQDLLFKISHPVVKESELMSLVRLQFRGLPEEQRRGFLFTDVRDANGRTYDAGVCTGVLASSLRVYAAGLQCKPEEISERWIRAIRNRVEPKRVASGPAHEVTIEGAELSRSGLGEIPMPVEIPGYSTQIRSTTAFITKDIETGIQNAGIYSGEVFGRKKILWSISRGNHGFTHLTKAAKKESLLDAAIVVGGPPSVHYAASAKVPYGVDELSVAGGLSGESIEVVRCKTVDLVVPATAEYVIEGKVSPTDFEPQTPFGEYTGYVAIDTEAQLCPVMEVTAITHRRRPIFQMIISQMPPSESSKLRQVSFASAFTTFLRDSCNLPNVKTVAFHESGGSWQYCVIQLKKLKPTDAWQALSAAVAYSANIGKIFIAVDEDIDPLDADSVNWALSFRMQPHRDIRIISEGKLAELDPSLDQDEPGRHEAGYWKSSAVLIDATMKHKYPPTSLPKKEYMERAVEIWRREGLPTLRLREPWYGYDLGLWNEKYEAYAKMIVSGKTFELGDELGKLRRKIKIDEIGM